MDKVYKVSELKKMVQESSEFKAKLGPDVEKDNKKNNEKAYSDAKNISKEHYGKELTQPKNTTYKKEDANRTTLDYKYDFEPTKDHKEKVKSQVKGYTSKDEENNGIEKANVVYDDKDKVYNALKDCGEKIKNNSDTFSHLGIWGHNMPKNMIGYPGIFEGKNVKTVKFKKTRFLTEGHMISRIPDEMKCEGTVFRMKDKNDNEYLIEWSDNRANIIGHNNKKGLDESLDRMKNLMNFNSNEFYENSNAKDRLNESNESFTNTLNNARKMNS